MQKRSATRRAAICLSAVIAWSTSSRAQPAPPTDPAERSPLTVSLTGHAKEAYDSAKILLNNHDFAGAYTKFSRAYELSKDPRLLFDMAVCARDLRWYARMQGLLLRYEREEDADLTGAQRAAVDEALATIREFVGAVRVTVDQDGASISVDGEPQGESPLAAPIDLDLGRHKISVFKGGFEPFEGAVEIGGGNETLVSVLLVQRREIAHLAIVAEPGSTVIIDRAQVGRATFEGTVSAGPHEVEVTAAGHKAYDVRVDLRPGETRSMQVMLPLESKPVVLWPWITGGVVVIAGAAVGAYLLLQTHDERGAPPPTTLGPVYVHSVRLP
jgi:hypothetical protein